MSPRATTSRPTGQGDVYVTWGMLDRVLELALGPITEKLDDVHADVRTLLDDKNQRTGADGERRRLLDSRRFVLTTIVALFCGLVASIATLVWLAAG